MATISIHYPPTRCKAYPLRDREAHDLIAHAQRLGHTSRLLSYVCRVALQKLMDRGTFAPHWAQQPKGHVGRIC